MDDAVAAEGTYSIRVLTTVMGHDSIAANPRASPPVSAAPNVVICTVPSGLRDSNRGLMLSRREKWRAAPNPRRMTVG